MHDLKVVLLCWEEFRRDVCDLLLMLGDVGARKLMHKKCRSQVESLQQLLDTLWKSYTQETLRDSTKAGAEWKRMQLCATLIDSDRENLCILAKAAFVGLSGRRPAGRFLGGGQISHIRIGTC